MAESSSSHRGSLHDSSKLSSTSRSSGRKRSSKTQLVPEEDKSYRYRHHRSSKPLSSSSSTKRKQTSIAQPGSIEDTLGFVFPFTKLHRIRENAEDDYPHQYPNSTRRSRAEDVTSRRAVRYKQSTLQHHFGVWSNPSLQSLLSGLTNTSSGSSGSNSTITQRSYDRSSTAISKGRRKSKLKSSNQQDLDRWRKTLPPKMQRRDSKHSMEENDEERKEFKIELKKSTPRSRSVSSIGSDVDASRETPATSNIAISPSPRSDDFVKDLRRQETFNSDSGISVSSSPEVNDRKEKSDEMADSGSDSDSEPSSSSGSKDEDEDEVEDGTTTRPSPTARSSSGTVTVNTPNTKALTDNDPTVRHIQDQEEEMRQHILHSPRPQRLLRTQVTSPLPPPSPLPLYDTSGPNVMHPGYPYPAPPPAPNVPRGDHAPMYPPFHQSMQHQMRPDAPFDLDLKKKTVAGYELLASQLSSQNNDDSVRPVYRKFEHLNHRILLHLQDEISELEEELRILDESIAQMTPAVGGNQLHPASRRAEAHFGSELHFRRTEVLGKVFVKLGQYNQALSSFKSAMNSFSPAHPPEIAAYRSWMDENAPIEKLETRFLNHEQDLIALSQESHVAPSINLRHASAILSILVLLPLLAFTIIQGFFARILLLLVVGCGGMTVASWFGMSDIAPVQHFAAGISIYFVVMALTAVIA